MEAKSEFRRSPMLLIVLAAVGLMQGVLAAQNLMYGRLSFVLLHLCTAVFVLGTTLWLSTVPVLRVEPQGVTVFKNAFRPRSLRRDEIAAVDVEGKRAFLRLADGSRLEVPVALARPSEREQILATLRGMAGS